GAGGLDLLFGGVDLRGADGLVTLGYLHPRRGHLHVGLGLLAFLQLGGPAGAADVLQDGPPQFQGLLGVADGGVGLFRQRLLAADVDLGFAEVGLGLGEQGGVAARVDADEQGLVLEDQVALAETNLLDDAGDAGGDLGLALGLEVADGLDVALELALLDGDEVDQTFEADLGGGGVGAAL